MRNESFIVGASLSPIRMNEMVEPAERWHGGSDTTIKGEKMYLSAVPSGAGGAYSNKMIGPFMRFLRLRMTYHDYDEEAKEERHNKAETGEQEKSGAAMKDVDWATATVPHSWHTRAAWPLLTHDGTKIHGQARSNDKKHFTTVDNYGRSGFGDYDAQALRCVSADGGQGHAVGFCAKTVHVADLGPHRQKYATERQLNDSHAVLIVHPIKSQSAESDERALLMNAARAGRDFEIIVQKKTVAARARVAHACRLR